MTKIVLQCVSIDHAEGYDAVNLQYTSTTPEVTTGGNLSFIVEDASGFEIGEFYDLNLNKVIY